MMTKPGTLFGAEAPTNLSLMDGSIPWLEPRRLLLLMVLAVFAVETLVMFVLQALPELSVATEALIDSSLLLVILSPTLYFLHYRPLRLHYQACRQATGQLQLSEERLRLAQAATNDGLWDWNVAADSVYYNPRTEELLGYSRDELKPFREALRGILHPDERTAVMDALTDHLHGGSEYYCSEQRVRCANGAWRWFLLRGQVVSRDPDGTPRRMIGTLTDIDDRKQAEQGLLKRKSEIQRLSQELMLRSEKEKRHLAQDLHDEFGQVLSAFQLGVEMLQRHHYSGEEDYQKQCHRLLGLVTRLEMNIRHISQHLRPVMLDDLGLLPTLQAMAEEFGQQMPDLQVVFNATPWEGRLEPELEVACYRICQEALHNCLKHSGATRVELSLGVRDDQVEMTIGDNGRGLRAEATDKKIGHRGMGLLGMRERAVAVGGSCEIQSGQTVGTNVVCRVPARFVEEKLCQRSAS